MRRKYEQRADKSKKMTKTPNTCDELQLTRIHQRFSQLKIRTIRDHFEKQPPNHSESPRRLEDQSAQSSPFKSAESASCCKRQNADLQPNYLRKAADKGTPSSFSSGLTLSACANVGAMSTTRMRSVYSPAENGAPQKTTGTHAS